MQTLKFSAFVLATPLMTAAFGSASANAQSATPASNWSGPEGYRCALTGTFPDGSTLKFGSNYNSSYALLEHDKWPLHDKTRSGYTLTIDGRAFWMPLSSATRKWGATSVIPVSSALLDTLAKGKEAVFSAEGMPDLTLNLKGAAGAVGRFRKCAAPSTTSTYNDMPGKARAVDGPVRSGVNDQPAQPPPGPLPPPPPKPHNRAIPARGAITGYDYPDFALILKEEGTVKFNFAIDTNGRAVRCRVQESSGSAVLDAASCDLIERRYRFTPATDADGKPVPDYWTLTMNWAFPE